MAEALSSFKQQFDNQLKCGVCLDQYTDPKMLPCYHTFCLECIQRLPTIKKNSKNYISCPSCRVDYLIGGAIKLSSDFKINSLLDLKEKFDTSQKAATWTICLEHNDPLKAYCETCHQVICCECAISEKHNTHNFQLISECYPKHRLQLQEGLHQIEQEMANVDLAISHLDDREKEVVQQGERLTEEINTHARKMIDQIVRSCIRLSQQVVTTVQQKTLTLRAQKQQAQKIHTQLKTCQKMIEHNLNEWNQQQILVETHIMLNEMSTATRHLNSALFEPTEKANIEFAEADLIKKDIGTISSNTYGIATLKVPSRLTEQLYSATLSFQAQDGSPFPLPSSLISSTLSSPSDNEVSVKCNVTLTNPGDYKITFTPPIVTTGEHSLAVQVGGVDIPNSPFTLPVIPIGDKPVMTIQGLYIPKAVAVCANGDIVVTECNCIKIFNKKGEIIRYIKTTTLGQFNNPFGVAILSGDHILMSDYHRLQKLTTDGVCVKSIGSFKTGKGQLDFSSPCGIAVHPTTEKVFVADLGNNRIQVFNGADLSYSHTIKHDKIRLPCDVAVDSEEYLYIANHGFHCVNKFTTIGQYIETIQMIKNARFSFLAFHHEHLYVTDTSNHRVVIFDNNGKQLQSFGDRENEDGKLNEPAGITVDTSGYVFVCDSHNNRIVEY